MYGYRDDLDKISVLYDSLIVQMFIALSQVPPPVASHGKAFNSSFLNGYVHQVLIRVRSAYNRAKDEVRQSSTGVDLVLRNRALAVRSEFDRQYPKVRRGSSSTTSSRSAYGEGKIAGTRADIGQSRLAGGPRAIAGRNQVKL